eukprot:15466446-Alexandrium_andersonii.AAC.1
MQPWPLPQARHPGIADLNRGLRKSKMEMASERHRARACARTSGATTAARRQRREPITQDTPRRAPDQGTAQG